MLKLLATKIKARRRLETKYYLVNKVANDTFVQMRAWVKRMEAEVAKFLKTSKME